MKAREILHKLRGVVRSGDGWMARCPAHDDHHNSLSVRDGRDGRVLLFCHAGCPFGQIVVALGIEQDDGRQIVATYDYRDERGFLLYQNVRYDPKGFCQRRPDGRGGWEYRLNGVRRVPYRLPELLTADPTLTVFLTEGEKDADNLAQLGLTASSFKNWRKEFSEYVAGRQVCLLRDHDSSGVKQAEDAARAITPRAKQVKVLDLFADEPLPENHGKDVSDWLEAGGTEKQLTALAEDAPLWNPIGPRTKPDRKTHFTFTTLDDLLDEPEEETSFVWDRTLPRGGFSIVSSKPKVGKSTLTRGLAVAVSRGAEFFGRPTSEGKVIYLCLEEKRAEVASHFRRMGASGANIIIHTGVTPDDALEALEAAILEHCPDLVIIDPLSRLVRVTDFNSYGEVSRGLEPLIDLARSSPCRCHIMAVHHNGKGEREGGDALLGSTAFFGAVDALLIMKRRERVRTVETIQRYGEDMPETVVRLDPETALVTPDGDMQAFLLKQRKEVVLECFGDEPLTEADVKERIPGKQGLTSKAVRSLHEEGRLIRKGAGKKGDPYVYQLPGAAAENPNENSGFSGSAISTDPENPESFRSVPDWNYPPDLDPDEFEARTNEIVKTQRVNGREAAKMVIGEYRALSSM